MSIKQKLLALIILVAAAFICSIGGYLLLSVPINKMNREVESLMEMRTSILQLQIEINKINSEQIIAQTNRAREAKEAALTSIASLETFTMLPRTNESVAEALGLIQRIVDFLELQWSGLERNINNLITDASKIVSIPACLELLICFY